MSHSRAVNIGDDLEHLELGQEVTESQSSSSQQPTPSQRDSRRVSINSLGSNTSSSTVKKYNPQDQSQGGQGYYGIEVPTPGSRVSSSGSIAYGTSKKPKGSSRHSGSLLETPSGSRRRRTPHGRTPGSSRSSIRQRNRSSDDDDDDDENDSEQEGDDYFGDTRPHHRRRQSRRSVRHSPSREHEGRSSDVGHRGSGDEDEDDLSDNEPPTLKDRQETLNQTHPFGLPLWKPALYKKSRSVIRKVDSALHSKPSSDLYLSFGNLMWTFVFGWWLALVCFFIAIVLCLTPFGGRAYGRVVLGLSYYLLWPFGQYVEREFLPGEYRTGDLHTSSSSVHEGPLHILVSSLCWFMVISIPMGKFTYVLATHLRRDPLRLHFKRGSSLTLSPQRSEILLCTYDAIGFQYYKYTYDGTNIIFINLIPVVLFTILDEYVLTHILGHDSVITSPAVIFSLGLASVIPLSYFIGMAVSSISAQSSLGMGAVINATFGSIIEIILYSVALTQGKGLITEGALIGSFLAGLLLMPGMSMMSGAVKKKEQKFNAKSAGVTATMLIMSLIGVLTPTLFYSIYGRFELRCTPCPEPQPLPMEATCQRCYHHQPNPADDLFFQKNVKPLMYFCCIVLPSAYLIGIWFSLRTHVQQIWHEQPNHPQDSSIYKKLLPIHIVQQLLHYGTGSTTSRPLANPSDPESGSFQSSNAARQNSYPTGSHSASDFHPAAQGLLSSLSMDQGHLKNVHDDEDGEGHGGHDSPNWSKAKSGTVLITCTVLYSIIAEILVNSVDAVSSIDEKLLGLTLFALVPNVTEFMNAISFAMYGNIALSMEIGSAYALQVCLIQIPAMVAVSAWLNYGKTEIWKYTFNLVFPRWDVFAMLFSVFLLTYTYIEGKSNYFKGSILILSYCVLMAGFFCAPSSPGNGDVSFLASSL
ncbi:hypothetical protein BGZ76_002244 [Entomortierella beljakovae]|nr:hypothetical protein BGZ76_002244 [Entomortierella beljakovae]